MWDHAKLNPTLDVAAEADVEVGAVAEAEADAEVGKVCSGASVCA